MGIPQAKVVASVGRLEVRESAKRVNRKRPALYVFDYSSGQYLTRDAKLSKTTAKNWFKSEDEAIQTIMIYRKG